MTLGGLVCGASVTHGRMQKNLSVKCISLLTATIPKSIGRAMKVNRSLLNRKNEAVAAAVRAAGYKTRAEAEKAGVNLKAVWEATK